MTQLLTDKINEVASELKTQFGENLQDVPDWAIAEKLNEPIVALQAVYQPIKSRDIETILILAQELYNIVDYIDKGENRNIKNLCYTAITALNKLEVLDINNPEYLASFQQIIIDLFQAELISETTKIRLQALIVPETKQNFGKSWAELNEIEVDARIVGLARGGLS